MKTLAKAFALMITTIALSAVASAHRIVLIQKSVNWITQITTGNVVPAHAYDFPAPLDIRVGFKGNWSHWFPTFPNNRATVQEVAHAIYKLEWIPDPASDGGDLPGTTSYSLLVDVWHAYGASSDGQSQPPGSSCNTTLQSWFASAQTYWPGGPTYAGTGKGDDDILDDSTRVFAYGNYACPVTFTLQNGRWIGDAILPLDYQLSISGTVAPGTSGVLSCWGGTVQRGIAKECAGVVVESP